MRYLVINTAISVSNIVLIEDNKVVSSSSEVNSNDLSSKIFFMIDEVFKKVNFSNKDLDKIFVVNGPGSFTGIRIGVTIAKTMAWALNIGLVSLSSLELLATTNIDKNNIISIIDARRGYVYAACYDKDLNQRLPDQYINLEKLLEKYPLISSNTYVSYDKFSEMDVIAPSLDFIKIVKKHENDTAVKSHFVNPVYLKLTEAEEKYNQDVCY